jgi:hypothetical protein
VSGRRVADERADGAQIKAIRDHLLTFRGGPSPKVPASAAKAANNN